MMNFISSNISPHPMFMVVLLLLGVIFIIGKYNITWGLGLLIVLVLLSPIIIMFGQLSWIYYILLFVIFVIVVIALFRTSGQGD